MKLSLVNNVCMKMLKVTKFQNFMFNHCKKNSPNVCFGVNVDLTVLAGLNVFVCFLSRRNPDVVEASSRGAPV